MHALPTGETLDFFCGKKLELLCFAAFSVYLHFESKILLTIEGDFEHFVQGGAEDHSNSCVDEGQFPLKTSRLMRIVSESVVSVEVQGGKLLRLAFSNGDVLAIDGDVPGYEVYRISAFGREIIV